MHLQYFIQLFVTVCIVLVKVTVALTNITSSYHSFEDDSVENEFNYLLMGGERSIHLPRIRSMVSIRSVKHTAFYGDNHICSGVIISISLIITAAHCLVE